MLREAGFILQLTCPLPEVFWPLQALLMACHKGAAGGRQAGAGPQGVLRWRHRPTAHLPGPPAGPLSGRSHGKWEGGRKLIGNGPARSGRRALNPLSDETETALCLLKNPLGKQAATDFLGRHQSISWPFGVFAILSPAWFSCAPLAAASRTLRPAWGECRWWRRTAPWWRRIAGPRQSPG